MFQVPVPVEEKTRIDFGILNYEQLLAKASQPIDYLVDEYISGPIPYLMEDFIPSQSLGIFVGNWGIGKSPFAMQMQLSLAA